MSMTCWLFPAAEMSSNRTMTSSLSDRAETMLWRRPVSCSSIRSWMPESSLKKPCGSLQKSASILTIGLPSKNCPSRLAGTIRKIDVPLEKRFAFPVELVRSYPIPMNEVQSTTSPENSSAVPTPVMTPREIVSELDRYIVGQHDAKRAVAIALRNRWRRQLVPEDLREEIAPKNIIMIGPTGVGKTEISRRLAKLAQAPFIKVEASKFTEVGYVGRDVESIIRDLTELAVTMVREEEKEKNRVRARELAEDRLLDLLLPAPAKTIGMTPQPRPTETREKLRRMLREGKLDERTVEIEVTKSVSPMIEVMTPQGMEEIESNLRDMLQNLMPQRTKKTTMRVPEALEVLAQEEAARLIDQEAATREAIRRVEQSGIVFLDEIDKIAGREGVHGPRSEEQQ